MKTLIFILILAITALVISIIYPKATRDTAKRVKEIREDRYTFQESYTRIKNKAYGEMKLKLKDRKEARKRAVMMVDKSKGSKLNETEKLLSSAGVSMTKPVFYLIRVACAFVFLIITYVGLKKANLNILKSEDVILAAIAMGVVGMLLPMVIIRAKVRDSKQKMLISMAEMMDLLSISTCAGLGIDAALIRIYEYEQNIAMDQMMITLTDIQHGVPRKEAYREMANRCDMKEMTAFVNALIQADEMGISISDVLSTQAELLRETRRMNAEEKAEKAPIKMTVPLVFCMFPAIFVVLLGPAVMELIEAFAEIGTI